MESHRHVALFFPTFTPGGIERVMLTLAQSFQSRGLEVDVLISDRQGPLEEQVPSGARIVDLEAGRVAQSLIPLWRYLRTAQPDALLSGHTHANLVCIWAAMLSGADVTTVVGVHTTESVKRSRGFRERFIRRMIPRTYAQADRLVAVSDGAADDLSSLTGLPRDRITVIHNPVPRPLKGRDRDVHPWITSGDYQVVLGAGRLDRAKDFPTLVRAFDKVYDRDPDARLIILGEGDDRARIEGVINQLGIEDQVDLPGYVKDPTPYMKGADVFVLSSRREGFGLVLVESMAVGTPVVSTDCPTGPAEILDDGEFGLLVPVGRPLPMAEAILKMIAEPVDPDQLKRRADRFSPETVADEYLAALSEG